MLFLSTLTSAEEEFRKWQSEEGKQREESKYNRRKSSKFKEGGQHSRKSKNSSLKSKP
jgi:hypothetical protein